MNEIIQRVIEKTGLPQDKAMAAVDTVIGFLKERLPPPVASQLAGFLNEAPGTESNVNKLKGIGEGIGGMFGRKE